MPQYEKLPNLFFTCGMMDHVEKNYFSLFTATGLLINLVFDVL